MPSDDMQITFFSHNIFEKDWSNSIIGKKPSSLYSLDDVNVWTFSANHFEELPQKTAKMDHKPILLSFITVTKRLLPLYNFYMETVAHVFEQSCASMILQSHVVEKDIHMFQCYVALLNTCIVFLVI